MSMSQSNDHHHQQSSRNVRGGMASSLSSVHSSTHQLRDDEEVGFFVSADTEHTSVSLAENNDTRNGAARASDVSPTVQQQSSSDDDNDNDDDDDDKRIISILQQGKEEPQLAPAMEPGALDEAYYAASSSHENSGTSTCMISPVHDGDDDNEGCQRNSPAAVHTTLPGAVRVAGPGPRWFGTNHDTASRNRTATEEEEEDEEAITTPIAAEVVDSQVVVAIPARWWSHRKLLIALSTLLAIGLAVVVTVLIVNKNNDNNNNNDNDGPNTETKTLLWMPLGQDIPGEAAGDRSGQSVSLSADGSIVAIGAPRNDGNGDSAGHVRVYQWNSHHASWDQMGTDLDGEAADDWSGYSVALSADGTTVAIAADGNDADGKNDTGHVRVYRWANHHSDWMQLGEDLDGEAAGDLSGTSVSLSANGTAVAIGAEENDGNGSRAGHVRVYQWHVTGGTSSWIQVGSDIDGEAADDYSGRSVSLSADGTTVAIGAEENDGNGFDNAGHVRVFKVEGGEWIQVGRDIDGEAANDWSGWSVSLSADGTSLAVGARKNDGNGNNSGHVRVFQLDRDNNNNNNWIQVGSDIDGEAAGDEFGKSVSLSADGTSVAVGADEDDGNGHSAGYVRVYRWQGGEWIQVGNDLEGEAAGDEFGRSVSLSADGTTVVVGAPSNDEKGTDAGHVRVYRLVEQ